MLDFERYNTENYIRRIRIGIIDSGIDISLSNYNGGSVQRHENGDLYFVEGDTIDHIGHGTAVAGLIEKISPNCELFIVKIFSNSLVTEMDKLIYAFDICIQKQCDIINVSAGTYDDHPLLKDLCNEAFEKNIVIIAALSNNKNTNFFPAMYKNCLGVASGLYHKKGDFFLNQICDRYYCLARGDSQRVKWLNGSYLFLDGDSFASANFCGIVALILSCHSHIAINELIAILIKYSNINKLEVLENSYNDLLPRVLSPKDEDNIRSMFQYPIVDSIKKALVISDTNNTILHLKSCKLKYKIVKTISLNQCINEIQNNYHNYDTAIVAQDLDIVLDRQLKDVCKKRGISLIYLRPSFDYGIEDDSFFNFIYDYTTFEKQNLLYNLELHEIRAPIFSFLTNQNTDEFQLFCQDVKEAMVDKNYNIVMFDTKYNSLLYNNEFSFCMLEEDQCSFDCSGLYVMLRHIIKMLDFIYKPDIIIISSEIQLKPDLQEQFIKESMFLASSQIESFIFYSPIDSSNLVSKIINNIEILSHTKCLEIIGKKYEPEEIVNQITQYFS